MRQLLEAWVWAHFDAPYPTPSEKDMLGDICGSNRAKARMFYAVPPLLIREGP
jgi:hypothetical protein